MADQTPKAAREAIANSLFRLNSMLKLMHGDTPVYELQDIVNSLESLANATPKHLFDPYSLAALRVQLSTDATIDWHKLVDVFGLLHQHSLFHMRANHKKQIAFLFTRLEEVCGQMDEVDAANFLLELFKRMNNKKRDVFPGLASATERRLVSLKGTYVVDKLVEISSPRRYTASAYEDDDAVLRVKNAIKERDLKQKVEALEKCTVLAPPIVQTVFEVQGLEEYPRMREFLSSEKMWCELDGFNSIVKPKKIVAVLKEKLGEGFICEARGKGKNASVHIKKPGMEEHRIRERYLETVKRLEEARADLTKVRGELVEKGTERKRLTDATNHNGASTSSEMKRARIEGKENEQQLFAW